VVSVSIGNLIQFYLARLRQALCQPGPRNDNLQTNGSPCRTKP